MPIDYATMQREFPKQKAALTRAVKKTDARERLEAVVATCEKTVEQWDEIGAWPDAWARWRVALDDAWYAALRSDHRFEGQADSDLIDRVHALHDRGL